MRAVIRGADMARVKLRPRDKFHRVVQGMPTGRARGAVGPRLASLPYAFALQACCCYVSRSPSDRRGTGRLSGFAITETENGTKGGEGGGGYQPVVAVWWTWKSIDKTHNDYAAVAWRRVTTSVSQGPQAGPTPHTPALQVPGRPGCATTSRLPTPATHLFPHANEAAEATDELQIRGRPTVSWIQRRMDC